MKVSYKVTVKEPGSKASIHYAEAGNQAEAIKIIKACVLIRTGAVLTAELDFEPTYIQNN
jgi:hypothetical protein